VGRLFLVVMLVGCAAESKPPPEVTIEPVVMPDTKADDGSGPDICALAAGLPADDNCSLACDPDALADRMLADGMASGRCYQLYCVLSDEVHVSVGVCLL
jgi:hypothetical protein